MALVGQTACVVGQLDIMKGFFVEERHLVIAAHLCFLMLIIVPFVFFGDDLDMLTEQVVAGEHQQEIAMLTISLLTLDVILPVPSSFVNTSAMLYLGPVAGFLMVFAGLSLGCILGYGFGYYFRKALFDRFYSDSAFRKLTFDLAKYGFLTLVVARGIPIIAELSVMAAGYHRYPLIKFLCATLLSNFLLAGVYALFVTVAIEVHSYGFFLFTLVAVPALAMLTRWAWVTWREPQTA